MKEKVNLPTDYKMDYVTYDGVSVSPDDEVWVCALDTDSFNYTPKSVLAKLAEDAGERIYFSTYEACLNQCEDANSL